MPFLMQCDENSCFKTYYIKTLYSCHFRGENIINLMTFLLKEKYSQLFYYAHYLKFVFLNNFFLQAISMIKLNTSDVQTVIKLI